MKTRIITTAALLALLLQGAQAQEPMTRQADGTYVVNTTTLARDVEGYNGPTPLEIHILKNKIVKVVALANQETPKYFARVKRQLLPLFEGLKTSKVAKTEVDGVSGATFSSKAVKENVRRGVAYYQKHK